MDTLTESTIHQYATSRSFERGREYYEQGSVAAVTRRGDAVTAEVEGSEDEPYEVSATFLPGGGVEAECDCPYEGTGWCKHIVAVLLHCIYEPDEARNLPPLETLLAPLDRADLLAVILDSARRNPAFISEIELAIARLPLKTAPKNVAEAPIAPPRVQADVAAIRKKARATLRNVLRGQNVEWDDNGEESLSELEEGFYPLIELAEAATEAGATDEAFAILEAITDELLNEWRDISDIIYDASDLFSDMGRAWAEAFLTTTLTRQESLDWIKRFEEWRKVRDESGSANRLQVGTEAARQGWDYPPLVRVLQGEITEQGAWEGERPYCADDLADARLNVLERQGRLQEAVYLAKAEGRNDRCIAALVRMGRVQEAAEHGMKTLKSADSALSFAKTLQERGETALALQVAEHGLSLQGLRYPLAIWLRDIALALGDAEQAILASLTALKEKPALMDYTLLQQFSDEKWLELREEILAFLREAGSLHASGKADIFLHEGLWEDALNAARGAWESHVLIRVVEAVTPYLPLEVIPICKQRAEGIMDAGKAAQYEEAASWARRARVAYYAAGRESEWREYKEGLLATHQRKYKLIPMLRAI